MAFNMLGSRYDKIDDDFIAEEDGYTPSFIGGSRTGGMKKFVKKQQRPVTATPALQKPTPLSTAKNDIDDDFDDLLDKLMEDKQKSKQKRPSTSIPEKRNTSVLDDLKFSDDSGFGPKESITYNIPKSIPKPMESSNFSQNSRDTFKLSDDYTHKPLDRKNNFGIQGIEQQISPLRNRRQSSLRKQSPKNIEDDTPSLTIGSSRMMRPPMRKPSMNAQPSQTQKQQSLNFSIPDQSSRLTQTVEPGKFGRRNSISPFQQKQQPPTPSYRQLKLPQNQSRQPSRLSRQSSSHFQPPQIQQRIIQKPVERIVERIVQKIVQGPKVDISSIKSQHQKQITLLKQSYEKQIKILTDNYQRQLKQQKQSRNKIMNDMKSISDRQRQNHERILKQEIQRNKKMTDWEKQKLQTMYKGQIERLKNIVSTQEKSIPEASVSYLEKRRIQDLQQKLKYQLDYVQSQKKKISKIQQDLQQRQSEFNKFRSGEEKKLKQQFTKTTEKSFKDMKKVSEEKNEVALQKQKIAVEMAELQMDILRRKEEIASKEEILKTNQENFQRTKRQAQLLNQQLYNSYKLKLQEVEQSKRNALLLQSDLLNKLKIVELKGKQVYKQDPHTNIFKNTNIPPKSTYTPSRPQSVTNSRYVPPDDHSKRLKNVQTYMRTQALPKPNKTLLLQGNPSFTLDRFIRDVGSYKKQKRDGIY